MKSKLPLELKSNQEYETKSWMHLGIVSALALFTIALLLVEYLWENTHMRNIRLAITLLALFLYMADILLLFALKSLAFCGTFFAFSLNCVIVLGCVTEGGSVLCCSFPMLVLVPGK